MEACMWLQRALLYHLNSRASLPSLLFYFCHSSPGSNCLIRELSLWPLITYSRWEKECVYIMICKTPYNLACHCCVASSLPRLRQQHGLLWASLDLPRPSRPGLHTCCWSLCPECFPLRYLQGKLLHFLLVFLKTYLLIETFLAHFNPLYSWYFSHSLFSF